MKNMTGLKKLARTTGGVACMRSCEQSSRKCQKNRNGTNKRNFAQERRRAPTPAYLYNRYVCVCVWAGGEWIFLRRINY